MSMRYFAHSGSDGTKDDWQRLDVHLKGVARRCADFARPFGIERLAALCGLLHDLGKYTPEFQQRLEGGARVDHSTAGAKLVLDRTKGNDRAFAELTAYAILGHHAGLPDRQSASGASFNRRMEEFNTWPDPIWEKELAPVFTDLKPDNFVPQKGRNGAFQVSVLGRMLFSCLIDADRKDTEAYAARIDNAKPDRDWPLLQDSLERLRAGYQSHMASFSRVGELNVLRRDILDHVRSGAAMAPGFFTLTVPTGGGKTLASLGFALDHAKAHGHRRIIYAIPFTSIIDQTAEIFRNVLGDDVVLEHHAAIDEEDGGRQGRHGFSDQGPRSQKDKLRLAMEDWAAPIIVTTNVQFFESLFAARPSRARKLHNIARSIIILDEAQTLPPRLLLPVMRVLEALVAHYGCSIVLCTATQPALGRREKFDGLDLAGRELAPDPIGLTKKLKRAALRTVGAMDNAALVDALGGEDRALVIVNSRKHALDLYRAAAAAELPGLVHLSTRQCATHRQTILAQVKHCLNSGLPCRVIATSLIEAGVDIDFPKVWRAEAGLDQIIQAAGRCNREGRRPAEESIVTIFQAPDYPPPREIGALIGDMGRALAAASDMQSLAAIDAYFQEVYWRLGERLDAERILDDFFITREGTQFAYRSAAEKFRMIESGMAPVIISYDAAACEAIGKLSIEQIPSGALARALQRYVVQVPPKARALLLANSHAAFVAPELRGDQFLVLDKGDDHNKLYKDDIGLLWEEADYLSLEQQLI